MRLVSVAIPYSRLPLTTTAEHYLAVVTSKVHSHSNAINSAVNAAANPTLSDVDVTSVKPVISVFPIVVRVTVHQLHFATLITELASVQTM